MLAGSLLLLSVDSVLLPGVMSLRSAEFAKALGEASQFDRLLEVTLGAFMRAVPKSQTLEGNER